MSGRVGSLILIFLVIGTFALSVNVQKVESTGTIYIRADGSVDPATAPIQRDGDSYTFIGNIYDEIVVESSNITVDGNGHMLQGSASGSGFYLHNINNVTIKNTAIKHFSSAIQVQNSSYNCISGNNITTNNGHGIGICYSYNNSVSGNTIIANNSEGITLSDSYNNIVSGNNITTNNRFGIDLGFSYNNIVSGNNITTDMDGVTLWGGVALFASYNNSVSGNSITTTNNGLGIKICHSFDNSVNGNNITANYFSGIDLCYSYNNSVSGNKIANNYCGIGLDFSYNNSVSGNNISNNGCGVFFFSSSNNSVFENAFVGDGLMVDNSSNNVFEDNLVNGKPLVYFEDASNLVIEDAGQVILANCNSITIRNLNISHTTTGVQLWNTNNTIITNNNVTANNWYGIDLSHSYNNTVIGNNIGNNDGICDGIYLDGSSNNTIAGNMFTNDGLRVFDSYGNVVEDNLVNGKLLMYLEGAYNQSVGEAGQAIFINCEYIKVENLNISHTSVGLQLWNTNNTIISGNNVTATNQYGIYLESSHNNSLCGNNISNNRDGAYLHSSSNNNFSGNKIANNDWGIILSRSSNNRFYHNNFVNNTQHVKTYANVYNIWDDGHPSGGNYWSSYEERYPNATEIDNTGIWDTPYTIDENNTDNYPLMSPTMPIKRVFTAYSLHVEIYSNSSLSAFQFNSTRKQLSFNTTGPSGTKGCCDVTIPDDLLWGVFSLFIDGSLLVEGVDYTRSHNGSHYIFNITYSHSTHTVEIIATEAIPEFPSIVISLLTMIATLLAIIVYKRKRWESYNTRALNRF